MFPWLQHWWASTMQFYGYILYVHWCDVGSVHTRTKLCVQWRFQSCWLELLTMRTREKTMRLPQLAIIRDLSCTCQLVLLARTDFSVDMSGQISSRRRHLSIKQWSGNKCGDVPTKIQTSIYAMDHRDWPGKQRLAEHQACRCTHLQRFSQAVKPFWRLILFCFLNSWMISFSKWYIIMSTKQNLCRYVIFSQKCCFIANFVDKGLVDDSTTVNPTQRAWKLTYTSVCTSSEYKECVVYQWKKTYCKVTY